MDLPGGDLERLMLRNLLDSDPQGLFFTDVEGRIVRASRALAYAMGVDDPAILVGHLLEEYLDGTLAEHFAADHRSIVATGVPVVELHERLASGERGRHHPAALLTMATAAGHASLGWPDAGRLVAGAPADLVTIGADSVRTAGLARDPLGVAVFAAAAGDVTHVVASGRVIVAEQAAQVRRRLLEQRRGPLELTRELVRVAELRQREVGVHAVRPEHAHVGLEDLYENRLRLGVTPHHLKGGGLVLRDAQRDRVILAEERDESIM